jgi:hypothetical protein
VHPRRRFEIEEGTRARQCSAVFIGSRVQRAYRTRSAIARLAPTLAPRPTETRERANDEDCRADTAAERAMLNTIVEASSHHAPIYEDRAFSTHYDSARATVNAYLARFAQRACTPLELLDEAGYAQVRKGKVAVGINVLEDHGVLVFLAPVMGVPVANREPFYRRLLELSFLTTCDAAFTIDAAKEEVFERAIRRVSSLDYEEFEDLLEAVRTVADKYDDVLKRAFDPG